MKAVRNLKTIPQLKNGQYGFSCHGRRCYASDHRSVSGGIFY